jgi:hypothetical protein
VFKLSGEADLAPVKAHFPVARRTAFVSFTSAGTPDGGFEPSPGIRVTSAPATRRSGCSRRSVTTEPGSSPVC